MLIPKKHITGEGLAPILIDDELSTQSTQPTLNGNQSLSLNLKNFKEDTAQTMNAQIKEI